MSEPEDKRFYVRLVLSGHVYAETEDAALARAKDICTNLECVDWEIKEAKP